MGLGAELEVMQSEQAGGGGTAILGPCVDEQAKKADVQSKAGKWGWESSRDATQRGIKAGNQAARAVLGVPGASRLSQARCSSGGGPVRHPCILVINPLFLKPACMVSF